MWLNTKIFCGYKFVLDKIIINGLPTHNYVSWAFSQASGDRETLKAFWDVKLVCAFMNIKIIINNHIKSRLIKIIELYKYFII